MQKKKKIKIIIYHIKMGREMDENEHEKGHAR